MVQTAKLEGIRGFQEEKTRGVSPWMLSLEHELGQERPASSWTYSIQDFQFYIIEGDQSLWIIVTFPKGGEVALRAAYCPYNHIMISDMRVLDDSVKNNYYKGLDIKLSSVTGEYHVLLEFLEALRKEVNPLGIKVTLIEPGAVGTDMQPQSPEEQRTLQEKMEMLKSEDIAACVLYALTQPKRCDVVVVQIRPHLQSI